MLDPFLQRCQRIPALQWRMMHRRRKAVVARRADPRAGWDRSLFVSLLEARRRMVETSARFVDPAELSVFAFAPLPSISC